jgi:hypothetical protein
MILLYVVGFFNGICEFYKKIIHIFLMKFLYISYNGGGGGERVASEGDWLHGGDWLLRGTSGYTEGAGYGGYGWLHGRGWLRAHRWGVVEMPCLRIKIRTLSLRKKT